ncbi:MAG TPA: T9SS type A sorting domain-containing protein [Bacteroidia bacterium]|nr:T9SS type A sorting domain-containing protein [Bacteroidota bacterium]HQW21899.1 T9SS type A sorting domain-containing protein [Bacteroidia bacterium]
MRKIYLVLILLITAIFGSISAQNTESTNSLLQEKMNVFYSGNEDNIHLSFTISTAAPIEIKIVDITGKEIRTINMPLQFPGTYSEILERSSLRDGIYIMQMNWGGKRFIKRFVIS